jgi:hypothetical protein
MTVGLSIPLYLTMIGSAFKRNLHRKWKILLVVYMLVTLALNSQSFWGVLQFAEGANPNQEIQLTLTPQSATAFPASDIYLVNGRQEAHISELVNTMGKHGLLFYQSPTNGVNNGPTGLIGRDDVVIVKINEEWSQRGGTNTDVLKEIIQAIIFHPDGFIGEIVVADNGQWDGSMNWSESNAEDHSQSTQDVVNAFSTTGHKVSTYSWMAIKSLRVQEYSSADMRSGYVLNDTSDSETGIFVSYPKFKTSFGTYISFKHGIWNTTTASYQNKLRIINVPVLKSHVGYGVTGALKHYMGVQSEGKAAPNENGLANGHESVATGGMGTLMTDTRFPTLNIIDAIYVNANPPSSSMSGPQTLYAWATRTNLLIASTDPVALDYWAAKYVLVQTASLIGYGDTDALNPDNVNKMGEYGVAFGVWLNLTRDEIVRNGFSATTDEKHINIYVPPAPSPSPSPSPTSTLTPTPSPTPTSGSTPSPSPTTSPPSPSLTSTPSPSPTTPSGEPPTMYIAAGIIGAFAVVAVVVMFLRKGK